jgi:hypothetical protein
MSITKENRGGARKGAGRPPNLSRQLAKADEMAKLLQIATKDGFAKIAETYGEVIETAIKLALGYRGTKYNKDGEPYEAEIPPDPRMLMKLLDIGINSLSEEDYSGARNPAIDLLKKAREKGGTVNIINNATITESGPAEHPDPITESVRSGPAVDVREYSVDGTRNPNGSH